MKHKSTGWDRKKEGSDEYKKYLHKAIEKLIKDGHSLPLVSKTTGSTRVFQIRGHEWIWDELEGYWQRHNTIYKHRARSDYRALYLGTIVLLMEEEVLKGVENPEIICALEAYCEVRKSRHSALKKMALARAEIAILLQEVESQVLSTEEFERDVQALINTIPEGDHRNEFSRKIDSMITEETKKLKNRKYQAKHRFFEQLTKGIQIVEE